MTSVPENVHVTAEPGRGPPEHVTLVPPIVERARKADWTAEAAALKTRLDGLARAGITEAYKIVDKGARHDAVDAAKSAALEALKAEGAIPRRVVLRQCKYLNNVIEQDHRTVKKRVWLAKGYGSFQTARRALQGIETVHMIRKGRVRWLAKGDAVGQGMFIAWLFGLAA